MTKFTVKHPLFWLGTGLGVILGWTLAQQLWALGQIGRRDVRQTLRSQVNRAKPGLQFESRIETDKFSIRHVIEDGLERISYLPTHRRFATPLLMQHGMWHGAWCWQPWQELLAEWGWESHAFSLPGHAGSPPQRNIARCTLDYYLGFLKAEVERLPRQPVLLGHSMGGALTQWYLKYVGDLAAAVLVAPWPAHSVFRSGQAMLDMFKLDPLGSLLTSLKWRAIFGVRTPHHAARLLLTKEAIYSPAELYARLTPESALILYQHNPPFWSPPEQVNTPLLWLAAEKDATVPEPDQRRSAEHYGAAYRVIAGTGHNLMMERSYRQTAELIHTWLLEQGIR
jgi:pimeloyl-ACP methyl ester carboxylesterase